MRLFNQYFYLSNAKVYINRTYTCVITICIIKSIRRSTQGSLIKVDRFVFKLTLNSNKLGEKVKILGK